MAELEVGARNSLPKGKLDALRPRLQTYLPADLTGALDGALDIDGTASLERLRETVHALNALHHNLMTYLPRPLVLSKPAPGLSRGELLEGTILFADVTGFTPLAERLRALGEEGAEQLNQMINALFTALLAPLSRSHGELLIFAGDAVLAYFPGVADGLDAARATRAGLRMARAIAPFEGGDHPLSMSIGLARGLFYAAQIGTGERMEYLVTGGPIQRAMQAEAQAAPRQVSLEPSLESLLAPQFRLTPNAGGYYSVVDDLGDDLGDGEPNAQPPPSLHEDELVWDQDPEVLVDWMDGTLGEIDTLATFFPPHVLARIVAHQRARHFPGEHRLVAVMFVNLRGFEALIAQATQEPGGGQEKLAQLTHWINRYFVEAQETLAGCGGLVTQVDPHSKGFTLLCPFGAPLADEELPQRAAAAALRLNERLHVLNQDLRATWHGQPAHEIEASLPTHHTGITYGPIYTGQVGWEERREFVVVGDDVNLSARLMSKAEPHQILISGRVYDRVRQSFECQPLEPMALKGKAKPVPVFAVERRVPTSAWLVEAAVGPLVGREEELTFLENALDCLEGGQGGLVTLVGETGLGKTRLVAELARRARYWNMILLAGRCLSYAQTTPYTPWIEILWRYFELDTAVDDAERRARVYQVLEGLGLSQLAETLVALLGLPQSQAHPAEPVAAPAAPMSLAHDRLSLYAVLQQRVAQAPRAQQNIHLTLAWRLVERDPALAAVLPSLWEHLGQRIHPDEALLTLFQRITQQDKPVVLLVEDLQWADSVSWTALVNLAHSAARHPMLVLVTLRPDQTERRWLAANDSIREAGTHVQRLRLAGLDWDGTAQLAARLIRAREAGPELVTWLHQRARGNPLFTSQLLYALAGAEGLSTDQETGRVTLSKTLPSLPMTVREIMLSRMDQLPEETRTVAKLAAVIGDTLPAELLHHLVRSIQVADQEGLEAHLHTLAERSLLAPAPPATEYAFLHPLLRDAVYSSIPYTQRRQWHRSIADYLVRRAPESAHPQLESLVYHYNRSDAPQLGARYNRLAGNQARKRQAWEEALGYYQAAIDVIGEDVILREPQDATLREPQDATLREPQDATLREPQGTTYAEEYALAYEGLGDVYALLERYREAAASYEQALPHTPAPARLKGKQGLLGPLLDDVDGGVRRMEAGWDELDWEVPLRPWLAAALGWVALRARPQDMAAVVGAGAAAVAWWQRGQRSATSDTVRTALREMMAGRVPPHYGRLVHLALSDTER